jgi:hypothetical protein
MGTRANPCESEDEGYVSGIRAVADARFRAEDHRINGRSRCGSTGSTLA